MTSEVIIYFMKNWRPHKVSYHRNFYQNRFINEYATKKKILIQQSRSFLVRYRQNIPIKAFKKINTYIFTKGMKGKVIEVEKPEDTKEAHVEEALVVAVKDEETTAGNLFLN